MLNQALKHANTVGFAAPSIELGGSTVLAADSAGLEALREALPPLTRGRNRFPLVLPGHSAFHTPLMAPMAACLVETPTFAQPQLPLVDGAGHVWEQSCDTAALRKYTIHDQVLTPYRFDTSLQVAINQWDPDVLVLLGPGASLVGPIGQVLSVCRHYCCDFRAEKVTMRS